jgi:hypothetical protein
LRNMATRDQVPIALNGAVAELTRYLADGA